MASSRFLYFSLREPGASSLPGLWPAHHAQSGHAKQASEDLPQGLPQVSAACCLSKPLVEKYN